MAAVLTDVIWRSTSDVELLVRYEPPLSTPEIEIESTFFELTGVGHGTLCRIDLGGRVESFVLDVNRPSRHIEVAEHSPIHLRGELRWLLGAMVLLPLVRFACVRGSRAFERAL